MSTNSSYASGISSTDGLLSRRSSDILLNLLSGEDSAATIGGGFYARYELKEVLGR